MEVNVRVEYESTPIRHIALQCPGCNNWFAGSNLIERPHELHFSYDIGLNRYSCPICGEQFGHGTGHKTFDIKEFGCADDVYMDCKQKKVTWE